MNPFVQDLSNQSKTKDENVHRYAVRVEKKIEKEIEKEKETEIEKETQR